MKRNLTLAILAKQKEPMLEAWLDHILDWDIDFKRIDIYARTNNNTDLTRTILADWLQTHGDKFNSWVLIDKDFDKPIQKYGVHEWNAERFKILGEIRNDSIYYSQVMGNDYLVVDVDNFLAPDTVQRLWDWEVPVVGPLLHCVDPEQPAYSNYHSHIDPRGYYANHEDYYKIWKGHIRGLIEVPVIHCTYLIKFEWLNYMNYLDDSNDYEYVVFSRNLRGSDIPQYLDNTKLGGYLTCREYVDKVTAAYKTML